MIHTMKRCLQRGAEFRPPISELFVRCAIFELNSKWHASLYYIIIDEFRCDIVIIVIVDVEARI